MGLKWNQDRWVSYLIQAKCFGDGKAPSSLECSPDHGRAGGGCGRGKTKRVLKVEASSLNTYVHEVHWSVEVGELWFSWDEDTMEGLCVCVRVCVCVYVRTCACV